MLELLPFWLVFISTTFDLKIEIPTKRSTYLHILYEEKARIIKVELAILSFSFLKNSSGIKKKRLFSSFEYLDVFRKTKPLRARSYL